MNKINIFAFSNKSSLFFDGKSSSGQTGAREITVYHQKKDKSKLNNFLSIEDKFIYESLKNSNKDEYTLICLDKIVTLCNTTQIYDYLEYVIDNINFDIFYLTSWCDRVDLYSDIHELNNCKIVKTFSTHGTSCLLFSPFGRKKFLDRIKPCNYRSLDFVLHENIRCFETYTSLPSLFEFDITCRESDLEFVKLSKCREIPSYVRPISVSRRNTTTLNVFWFILILIIILCVAAMLLSFNKGSGGNASMGKSLTYPYMPYDIESKYI